MALGDTYIIGDGSVIIGGVTLTCVTAIRFSINGDVTPVSTDGSRNVNRAYMDNLTCVGQISVSDLGQLGNSNILVGKTGAATIKGYLRGNGSTITATTKTVSLPEVTITGADFDVPGAGEGAAILNFQAFDTDGLGFYTIT